MAGGLFIHLVEDDDAARDSLAFLLRAARYSVQTFSSAHEYLSLQAPEPPDCVITDLRMPGAGGLELIRLLRERGSHVPVVVITGDGDAGISDAAYRVGAYAVLYKPFDDERMLATVAAAAESVSSGT